MDRMGWQYERNKERKKEKVGKLEKIDRWEEGI